ncbi:YibE/F family protein [Cellulomonas sp. DKR-3]|uniref:YibE/F family protein n=1 Tax=Cellulomonas fulva TaxID=2835530 RepID=A0ABS5TUY5_9CELL|nr:YibE/F family protein [Cellulomonas fulva]MBT0992948.1 YibE/F family protein [Cellulomonas fulva]
MDHAAHVHALEPARVAPRDHRRARRVFAAILLPALALTLYGLGALWPRGEQPVLDTSAPGSTVRVLTVEGVDPGAEPGQEVTATLGDGTAVVVSVPPEYLDEVGAGDRLRVVDLGSDDVYGDLGTPYVFLDFVRGPPLAALGIVFGVLVLLVARWRGLGALVGLGLAFGVLGVFTLPALLAGMPALPVALVSSSLIMFVVLYLAHGVSLRTSTALLGTLVGLVLTAGIAAWATGAAHLTGLSDEYALDLRNVAPAMSLRDVLLCGMVLAGLGVLNDVTITQASAVWELRAADPAASRRDLFTRGMRIGRDHIASTVYTIAFAYVGAALPLVLLVSVADRALLESLTSGELAEEVARTLVGSIGLVLAIPVTTAIAALVVSAGARPPDQDRRLEQDPDHRRDRDRDRDHDRDHGPRPHDATAP